MRWQIVVLCSVVCVCALSACVATPVSVSYPARVVPTDAASWNITTITYGNNAACANGTKVMTCKCADQCPGLVMCSGKSSGDKTGPVTLHNIAVSLPIADDTHLLRRVAYTLQYWVDNSLSTATYKNPKIQADLVSDTTNLTLPMGTYQAKAGDPQESGSTCSKYTTYEFRWEAATPLSVSGGGYRVRLMLWGANHYWLIRFDSPLTITWSSACDSEPCANGATCQDEQGGAAFSCSCASGFKGALCEINVDECASQPCQNGGKCVDGADSFVCACAAGFGGAQCEVVTSDECASAPCMNGATCHDELRGFSCSCRALFTGDRCQTALDVCASAPCANGGSCALAADGAVTCSCAPGFSGALCLTNIDDCASAPCINGGTCRDGVNNFTCKCDKIFTGRRCELSVDECAPVPCKNSATCLEGVGSYVCVCAPGFSGKQCQTNIDECKSKPCLNNGLCVDGVLSYVCVCAPGFTGDRCQTNIDECASAPCANGARCKDAVNGYTCYVPIVYPQRAVPTSAASWTVTPLAGNIDNDKLKLAASCAATGTVSIPACTGYGSVSCSQCPRAVMCSSGTVSQANPDTLHAIIQSLPIGDEQHRILWLSFTLKYLFGVNQGLRSDVSTNPKVQAALVPETAGDPTYIIGEYQGKASAEEMPAFVEACTCEGCYGSHVFRWQPAAPVSLGRGYRLQLSLWGTNHYWLLQYDTAFTLHWSSACDSEPCANGATCQDEQGGAAFSCSCASGFKGPLCEINIDECASQPCQNGGQCVDGADSFVCACDAGHFGERCEHVNDNECASAPCQNGGRCKDGIFSFECACVKGFTGARCESVDWCVSAPCQHGASCRNLKDGFTCACVPGFSGVLCQTNVDECASAPCKNGGRCQDGLNSFACTCVPGFSGASCQTNINECASAPCQAFGSCRDGINSFVCACPAGFSGRLCEVNIDECAGAPCGPAALCVDGINSYSCVAPVAYPTPAVATAEGNWTLEPMAGTDGCLLADRGVKIVKDCVSTDAVHCSTCPTKVMCSGSTSGENTAKTLHTRALSLPIVDATHPLYGLAFTVKYLFGVQDSLRADSSTNPKLVVELVPLSGGSGATVIPVGAYQGRASKLEAPAFFQTCTCDGCYGRYVFRWTPATPLSLASGYRLRVSMYGTNHFWLMQFNTDFTLYWSTPPMLSSTGPSNNTSSGGGGGGDDDESSSSTGKYIGIGVGGGVFVLLVVVLVWFFGIRRRETPSKIGSRSNSHSTFMDLGSGQRTPSHGGGPTGIPLMPMTSPAAAASSYNAFGGSGSSTPGPTSGQQPEEHGGKVGRL